MATVAALVSLTAGRSDAGDAVVCRALNAPPGALYLYGDVPGPTVLQRFFLFDGNDKTFDLTPGPRDPIVGLATRSAAAADAIRTSLSSAQRGAIRGKGFVPDVEPSVAAVSGPDGVMLDRFVADLLTRPHITFGPATEIHGSYVLGTVASPQITYFPGQGSGFTVRDDAQVSGAGILVVDDSLTVFGILSFQGLVIVRGPFTTGTADLAVASVSIFGSIWSRSVAILDYSGVVVQYDSDALGLAASAGALALCEPCMACDAMGCVPAPRTGCQSPATPRRDRLVVVNASRDRVAWTSRTATKMLGDFGDPFAADDYTLCVFGGQGPPSLLFRATAAAGDVCGGKPCWRSRGARGFAYEDSAAPGGLRKVRLTVARDGAGKFMVVGGGEQLELPPLPVPTPLTVQLLAGDGSCWEADYATVVQDDRRLDARGAAP